MAQNEAEVMCCSIHCGAVLSYVCYDKLMALTIFIVTEIDIWKNIMQNRESVKHTAKRSYIHTYIFYIRDHPCDICVGCVMHFYLQMHMCCHSITFMSMNWQFMAWQICWYAANARTKNNTIYVMALQRNMSLCVCAGYRIFITFAFSFVLFAGGCNMHKCISTASSL